MAYESQTYVYLMAADLPQWKVKRNEVVGGRIKVGVAATPTKRRDVLQTGCPFPIKIIETWEFQTRAQALTVEREFHMRERMSCVGGEWFCIDPEEARETVQKCVEYCA